MTNSQWLSWFLYIHPWWLAPVRVFVEVLAAAGFIIIGIAKINIRYIALGIGIFIMDAYLTRAYDFNFDRFFLFKLMAVKVLYSVAIVVLVIVLFLAARIIIKKRHTSGATTAK